jgi:hypothetical protein
MKLVTDSIDTFKFEANEESGAYNATAWLVDPVRAKKK